MKVGKIFTLVFFAFTLLFVSACDKKTTESANNNTTQNLSNMININYYDNDKLIDSKSYEVGSITLLVPEKEDYSFIKWYFDKELKIEYTENKINEYLVNNSLSLYSSWEYIKLDYMIEIVGYKNDKSVINPVFTWNDPFNDTEFMIKLMKGDEEVASETVTDKYYIAPMLDYSTEYKFILTSNNSNNSKELTFNTMDNNNYNVSDKVVLNDPFMDNMVLQREENINISGKGPKCLSIVVDFGNNKYFGVSDENGNFNVEIPAHKASFEPLNIVVGSTLSGKKEIKNVLIGDVYFFTGQSNMQWMTKDSDYLEDDINQVINNDVRFFAQNVVQSSTPLEHTTNGRWFSAKTAEDVMRFSAIATMTSGMLSRTLKEDNIPIGILSAYQGDTNIANWMGSDYYTGSVSTKHLHYNAMVYPLRHVNIKAVIWYQGCNNSASGGDYKDLLLSYFDNYRYLFNNEELVFYVIGLACYDGDNGNNYDFSYVRESQAMACSQDDKAYFISTCDDGDPTYIHPNHKRYICDRITKSILSEFYDYVYLKEGPSYKSHTVDGNTVIVKLNNADGLYSKGEINNFYLAGEDGKYYPAVVRIEDDKLIAQSDKVDNPVYIKYGFGKSPFVNIFNMDKYSMVPFRTDHYNENIDLLDYSSTDKYKYHPDGSKMEIQLVDDGLKIKKTNDGKTYGSVRLEKWGMIAYETGGFRFRVTGTNSNAKITFRAIEGPSYETWGYDIVDNFVGEKTFEIAISDFKLILNKSDNNFNTQCISYIEIMVEVNGEAEFIVNEARFISIERSEPKPFTIDNIAIGKTSAMVNLNKSLFADSYKILVSDNSNDFSNPLYQDEKNSTLFTFDITNLEVGKPYYLRAIAINELGETICKNDGYVFYINDENTLIINNFDFESQAALDAYIQSNMKVHSSLNCVLVDHSLRIESNGGGWQNFIFVIETGSNVGKNKLVFDADFTNYKGTVVMEVVDPSWQIFQYKLDITSKKSGTFTLDLTDFISKSTAKNYNGEQLMWITFNFSDSVGDGYILFDNCKLTK